ncbi:MAG: hypothetical protein JSS61_02835 [Verrucomicrobia bacterium]|nr:hypothetical protein [Verrucomicrobiota bacterium]
MEKEQLPFGRAAFAKAICVDWITTHSKTMIVSFMTLIAMTFSLYHFMGKWSSGKKSDYMAADAAFDAWYTSESPDASLLKQLEIPLDRHPELRAKFGNLIAQRCLSLGQMQMVQTQMKEAFQRAEDLLAPYYTAFAKTTLLIAEAKHAEALVAAKQLKADLEADDAFWEGRDKLVRSGPVLYAYNLIRIAALERVLGSREGELAAWTEFEKHALSSGKMDDPQAYAHLTQNFQEGDVSLLDYIEQRKQELSHP